jgi:hypothetical protein
MVLWLIVNRYNFWNTGPTFFFFATSRTPRQASGRCVTYDWLFKHVFFTSQCIGISFRKILYWEERPMYEAKHTSISAEFDVYM